LERNKSDLSQGTLDLLILKAIGDDEFHGLRIARRVEQITRGTSKVGPGSLFPALHRMEEAGWLSSFWGESENSRSFIAGYRSARRHFPACAPQP
jgi:DNA-binding PadR family transcriptional regulator